MQQYTLAITDKREGLRPAFPNSSNTPMILGCNYFTGELSPGRDAQSGQIGLNAVGAEDWEMVWISLGLEPPGKLPEGAAAYMFVDGSHPDCHVTTSVSSATRTNDNMHLEWEINYIPKAEEERRCISFAVVILPATEHKSTSYNYVDEEARIKKRAEFQSKIKRLKTLAEARIKLRPI